ncbi:MAG: DNA helicase [Candidatus Eisenbacteria bacterium]
MEELFRSLDADFDEVRRQLLVDDSDGIRAEHVVSRLDTAPPHTLVVIDYLQLLDERRDKPSLMEQLRDLKSFAQHRKAIVLCLSQIDRRYDPTMRPCPDVRDIRMPNPLDPALFDRTCFLGRGRMRITPRHS